MRLECLPLATTYDPAEDPPGSIDPLGTVAAAEQLADVLFSGFTARMWRARHLTFAALAAFVAEQATGFSDGDEELRLEARLALERLFVSAVARREKRDDKWRRASRQLPGISLARRALSSDDQPLGKQTFLKGQAVNGPFGVVARLARRLDIIDDDNRISRNGQALLLVWSAEQELPGLLDEGRSESAGAMWIKKLVRFVLDYVNNSSWPKPGWWGWSELADRLRPDKIGPQERKTIRRLLASDGAPMRRRCLELLEQEESINDYRSLAGNSERGLIDRRILVTDLQSLLQPKSDVVDCEIDYAIRLVDAYEQVGGGLESVMRGLLWGLTHHGGRATPSELLTDPRLSSHVSQARSNLRRATRELQLQLSEVLHHPQIQHVIDTDRLDQLLQDAQTGIGGEDNLVNQVMERHSRVQQQKKKGAWIERSPEYWTLIPGFSDSSEEPWKHDGTYLHPFRVTNAYSFLSDLGRIPRTEVLDAEEE
jgi:hypothetical protein